MPSPQKQYIYIYIYIYIGKIISLLSFEICIKTRYQFSYSEIRLYSCISSNITLENEMVNKNNQNELIQNATKSSKQFIKSIF